MTIGLAADHDGFALKETIAAFLKQAGYEVVDFGAHHLDDADDYPDFVFPMARAVAQKRVCRGIAICGSGLEACITANKIHGVKAAAVRNALETRKGVENYNVNVLCLGSHAMQITQALICVESFLKAQFADRALHNRRLDKIFMAEFDQSNLKIF